MPQPIRSFTDAAGVPWLVLDNGHRIPLPAGSGSGTDGEDGAPGPPGETGPPGPPGPTDVSHDDGNAATLGSDDLIFVPFPGTSGGTIPSTVGHVLTAIDEVGHGEWMVPSPLVTEGPPSDEPENPLTVNLGTLHSRHGGSLASRTSAVTITSTVATSRVPGSLALQWTQTVPAMVTVRAATYLGQAANSTISIYFNVGVEDGNGTKLLTDSFGVPTTTATVGGTAFRTATGGLTYVPAVANWRRYLPPGTYMAYPVAWCNSIDAGSAKSVGVTYLELEIDPDMTNLPGIS